MNFLITLVIVVALSLVVLGIGLWIFGLAKKDINFTELAPNTGKMIRMGADIVKILFNSDKEYYKDNGTLTSGKQSLGIFFDLTGRIFFGISPIYEVFHFDTSWGEYVEEKETEDGKKIPPSVISRKENGTNFKRYYPHSVMIRGAEMAKESGTGEAGTGGKDTSTTRIDAAMLTTIELTNIRDAVYKMPPQGIVFAQANAALQGAFNDYVKGKTWEKFREEDKLSQASDFVTHILTMANPVLDALGIGMRITIVELKYYDLTVSAGNEAFEESQTLLLIAQNKGAAEVALAEQQKKAAKLRGEGEAEALQAIEKVVGKDNIASYANLGQVAKTQLRVYGPTNAVPIVETGEKS